MQRDRAQKETITHLTPVRQVRLVADQHNGHLWVGVLPRVLQPRRQVRKRLPARHVVHQQSARCSSIIRPRDRPEALLPRSIPDLQLDLLAVDRDHPRAEFDADGEVVDRLEALVRELEEEAGLADARVADDDVLEEVAVGWGVEGGGGGWGSEGLNGWLHRRRRRAFAQARMEGASAARVLSLSLSLSARSAGSLGAGAARHERALASVGATSARRTHAYDMVEEG